jgi:hypothetical protein
MAEVHAMQKADLQKPEPPSSEEAYMPLRIVDEHLRQTWKQLFEVEEKMRSIKKEVLRLVYQVSPLDTFQPYEKTPEGMRPSGA